MSKVIILYRKPKDPNHFMKHFGEVHAPLIAKLPGLRSHSFGPTKSLDGLESAYFWIFIGTFDSQEAISEAFGSPEGKATVVDVQNYSENAPTMLYLED